MRLLYFLFLVLAGCSSISHRRELLQRQNPECEVTEELEIICPMPDWFSHP